MLKTLRLKMPEWQGGNLPQYYFGPSLLAWLAPKNENTLEIEVPIEEPSGEALPKEDGLVARSTLMKNFEAAYNILEEQKPDRVVTFGGDCLVSQAPFAYLNERYDGELGILWLDAHPDVSNTDMMPHGHAMVLGNLLGEGDPGLAYTVRLPIKPENVMYGGLMEILDTEAEILNRLQLHYVGPEVLKENSDPIIDWIKEKNIKKLAIHFDLDVMDPASFRSLMFTKPEPDHWNIDAPCGKFTFEQVIRIFKDVAEATELVGLSIAEYFPWDCMNMKAFLDSLAILK